MDRWAKDMKLCLEASKVEIYMLCKYVDDVSLSASLISKGFAWVEGRGGTRELVFSEGQREIDREKGEKGP